MSKLCCAKAAPCICVILCRSEEKIVDIPPPLWLESSTSSSGKSPSMSNASRLTNTSSSMAEGGEHATSMNSIGLIPDTSTSDSASSLFPWLLRSLYQHKQSLGFKSCHIPRIKIYNCWTRFEILNLDMLNPLICDLMIILNTKITIDSKIK